MKFLYDDYKEIIDLLKHGGYRFISYDEAGEYDKEVLLRHDVDVSLSKALHFAKYEKALGIKATYYILISSPFYNVLNKEEQKYIYEIKQMGHDIGLHFDETNYVIDCETEEARNEYVKKLIIKEKAILESALPGITIKSVSMHIPSKMTLEANLSFADGFINSYGFKFFKGYKYVSDSEMRWREDVYQIIKCGDYDKLHVLTHPIWYDTSVKSKKEKVKDFLTEIKNNSYKEINIIVPGIDKELDINEF